MKVGIIRCQQTEDICPGTRCFSTAASGQEAFEPFGEVHVLGFVSCGGCPGKKSIARALDLERRGAEVVVIASCVTLGLPWDYVCPHVEKILEILKKKLKPETKVVEWTHR